MRARGVAWPILVALGAMNPDSNSGGPIFTIKISEIGISLHKNEGFFLRKSYIYRNTIYNKGLD
jgi:hypothetical protein